MSIMLRRTFAGAVSALAVRGSRAAGVDGHCAVDGQPGARLQPLPRQAADPGGGRRDWLVEVFRSALWRKEATSCGISRRPGPSAPARACLDIATAPAHCLPPQPWSGSKDEVIVGTVPLSHRTRHPRAIRPARFRHTDPNPR